MSTITDKLWGIYRESRDAGLDVSLTVSICNGAETFVFKSVPSNGVRTWATMVAASMDVDVDVDDGEDAPNGPHEAPARLN